MSQEIQERRTGRGRTLSIVAWVVGSVVLLGILLYLTYGSSIAPPHPPRTTDSDDHPLVAVRNSLARQTDPGTCRLAMQRLNEFLNLEPDQQVVLSAEAEKQLRSQFGLDDDEIRELQSPLFTPLDGHHLETCLLLRDMARSLELSPPPRRPGANAVAQTPLEQATAAFEMVVRQVRIQGDEPTVPTNFVLRRGWGTVRERALLFLALLEEFGQDDAASTGLQGCLLFVAGDAGPRLWACGVAIGDRPDALYLYDPRLGLPIPGPGGKGVATLAQVCQDPAILGQWKLAGTSLEVTPKQAAAAEVKLVCPLSALAPRQRLLQNVLLRTPRWKDQALPPSVRVRVALDPEQALASLRKAVEASGGGKDQVGIWREGTGVARRFLLPEEGGIDKGTPFRLANLAGFTTPNDPLVAPLPRKQIFLLQAVPWQNFPGDARDPVKLRHLRYDQGLGQRLRNLYWAPFLAALIETDTPRELMLRGSYGKAKLELGGELARWEGYKQRWQRASKEELDQQINEWLKAANDAYAQRLRAQTPQEKQAAEQGLQLLWKGALPIDILLTGRAAELWTAELTWNRALASQELAERLQARLDLAAQSTEPSPLETEKRLQAWEDARGWWREYANDYRTHPGQPLAKRLRARGLIQLKDWNEAVKVLEDPSGFMTDADKLALAWLAQQAKANRPR